MLKFFGIFIIVWLPLTLLAQVKFQTIGQPQKLIVSAEDKFIQPVWSPDGAKIAFSSGNYKGLWVVNSDGTSPLQLSDEPGAGFDFQWAADSRDILTRISKYQDRRRMNAIKIINIESKSEKIIADFTVQKIGLPKWTPDNSQVYFYNGKNLALVNTGKKSKVFTDQPLYFLKYGKIYSLGSSRDMIDASNVLIDDKCLNLRISPDGKKISYERLGGNLFVINSNGSNKIDLGKGYNARWSPDSNYLVYMITEDDGHKYLSSDLYIIDINNKNKVKITNTSDRFEMNPSWSPRGDKIVYDDDKDGALYLLTLIQ